MPLPTAHPLATPFLDPATIERVVGWPDPVARNAAITRGYHELAAAVAWVLGRENANWLCFGQWASSEAGRAIRGESLPGAVRRLLGTAIAEAVAGGNAAIFGDVGPPFARFVDAFAGPAGASVDAERAARLLDRLFDHPQLAASEDLRRAFAAYADVVLLRDEPGPEAAAKRAARMLVANVSIGAHEQIVADPFVRAAIPGRSVLAVVATAHLGIRIPEGTLALQRDVPPPTYLGGAAFPAALAELVDVDALALANRFGQDPGSTIHSDAPDWEDYDERMGYIFCFLRAYQQDPELFDLPPDLDVSAALQIAGEPPR